MKKFINKEYIKIILTPSVIIMLLFILIVIIARISIANDAEKKLPYYKTYTSIEYQFQFFNSYCNYDDSESSLVNIYHTANCMNSISNFNRYFLYLYVEPFLVTYSVLKSFYLVSRVLIFHRMNKQHLLKEIIE